MLWDAITSRRGSLGPRKWRARCVSRVRVPQHPRRSGEGCLSWTRRVCRSGGNGSCRCYVFALVAALILYFFSLFANVLLLIFAGILLATLLHGLARLVVGYARLPAPLALAAVVAAVLAAMAATGYFLAPHVSEHSTNSSHGYPLIFTKFSRPWSRHLGARRCCSRSRHAAAAPARA